MCVETTRDVSDAGHEYVKLTGDWDWVLREQQIRLSIGLEYMDDILVDLSQVLDKVI